MLMKDVRDVYEERLAYQDEIKILKLRIGILSVGLIQLKETPNDKRDETT